MILFVFHVWGRTKADALGVRRGSITAACRAEAEAEARRLYPDAHLDVISNASWDAMSPKARLAFVRRIPDPESKRSRHRGEQRAVVCRICGKPVPYTRDAEGRWPRRPINYHDGRCRTQYNLLQQEYRANRKGR